MARSRMMWLGLGALLAGCPPTGGTPTGTTDEPPQNPQDPPLQGSVCAHVSDGASVDDTAGVVGCPEVTADAIEINWSKGFTFRNRPRSCVHFVASNLLDEEIVVEFETSTNAVGSDYSKALPMPPHEKRRTFETKRGGVTEVNMQIAYDLNVLEDGEWAEVHVRARLLSPVETEWMEMPMTEITSRIDEYGRIDDIDYRQ